MQVNINRRRTLNAIRSPRVCDLQSIELIGQPQTFDPVLIDQLANLILDSGNLATPLLVRRRDNLKYTLVAGALEYQAALRAREIEPSFKDVLAYILDSETEQNMRQQRQISSHLESIHAAESHAAKTTASGWQVAQPGASYNVTPQVRTGTTGKSSVGSTGTAGTNLSAKNSATQNQQDLTEVLNAIHQLEENLTAHLSQELLDQLTSHLSSHLSSHLGAQLTSAIQVIQNLLQSTPSVVPVTTASATATTTNFIPADRPQDPPQSQPTDPALSPVTSPVISPATPKSAAQSVVQSTTTPQKSPSKKSEPKQPKPTVPAPSSTNTRATNTASAATESAIIAYFNTQPVTKAFLQSLTVGEKASRKIQAAVPLQIQIRPFTNGADLQQRIPEVGPVIWEKIQQNWHTVTIPNQAVNPVAATPETQAEDLVTTITETITEILTESIPEPSAPPITVEIPAETIPETITATPPEIITEIIPETIGEPVAIPHHLQRLNQLLSTGEGMYQLLIELKHIGFTHKIAQKFIDGIHIHAPFTTFSDLQKVAGLNATNWRYFMHAFPND
jgi:hypothetical protein